MTHPDRYPVCGDCIALADPVTGLSPRCSTHRPNPRSGRAARPAADLRRPERGAAELELDDLRARGIHIPTAHDFRDLAPTRPKGHP